MNKELRERAVRLRVEKHMSYSEIRKQLGVSKSTLSLWLREYPLSEKRILELRRAGWSKGEASRERYRNTMREKRELEKRACYEAQKQRLQRLTKDSLYVAGLMLYAAEGEKKSRYRVALSNTDAQLIRFHIQWLTKHFEVTRSDLRVQLHLYENMDIKKEEQYWLEVAGLERNQLYKTQVRALRPGSFTYASTHGHGTCAVEYSRREVKEKIEVAIQAFLDLHSR